MTKQELINLNQTLFADETDIIASELRQYNTEVVNELFPTTIRDTAATQIFTTASNSNKFYYAEFNKVGSTCFIRGYILNLTSSLLGAGLIFSFKDTVEGLPNPFLPDPSILQPASPYALRFVGKATRYIDGSEINVHVVYDHITGVSVFAAYDPLPGAIGSLEYDKFMFNFSYNIKP